MTYTTKEQKIIGMGLILGVALGTTLGILLHQSFIGGAYGAGIGLVSGAIIVQVIRLQKKRP